jgi:hypothetical protein
MAVVQSGAKHFVSKRYPRFGRGKKYNDLDPPKSVTDSPYFWWYRYLQLNEDYKLTEEQGGIGPCAEVFAELGPVHSRGFKEWWRSNEHLFASEPTAYTMRIIASVDDLAPFDTDEAINIVVPLNWTKKGLKKRFSQIIDKLFKARQLDNSRLYTARYQLATKANVSALELAHNIYKLRQQNLEKGVDDALKKPQHKGEESHKYRLSWADLAIRARQPNAIGLKEGAVTEATAEKRRLATIIAARHYKRALLNIQAAASSKFPT